MPLTRIRRGGSFLASSMRTEIVSPSPTKVTVPYQRRHWGPPPVPLQGPVAAPAEEAARRVAQTAMSRAFANCIERSRVSALPAVAAGRALSGRSSDLLPLALPGPLERRLPARPEQLHRVAARRLDRARRAAS